MALSTGQIISGAGVIARKQREGEEAERIAQANQLRIEALNRAELLRGENLQAEMPGLRMPTYDPGMYRTDVEQITAPRTPVEVQPAPESAGVKPSSAAATTSTVPWITTPEGQATLAKIPTNKMTQVQWDALSATEKQRRIAEINRAQRVRVPGAERFDVVVPPQQTAESIRARLPAGLSGGPTSRRGPRTPQPNLPPLSADQAKIRGFRNNNPGNLRPSEDQWQGMLGVDRKGSEAGYLIFDSPESGIRALAKNLLTYQRNGVNTIEEIISRWAPASDNNNTEAYIKFVSDRLGVPRDATLNVSNPNTMQALVHAIITKENGSVPYSSQTLLTGIQAAYSGAPATPTAPAEGTAEAPVLAGRPAAPAAGVAPTATAAAVPQPPREFFGARPEAVSNQIKQSLRQRDELVRMANMYRNSGMGNEYMQVRQQVMALDENMLYLQGMQGLSEFSFGNDPGRLSAAWSAVTDNNIRIQPRTDGKFNLLVNGKKIQDGMTESEVTQAARSSFDTAYVQAMQQYSAEANMERYKSVLRREEAIVTQQAQGERELRQEEAKMIANIFAIQAKGNIDMGIEMSKQNGYKVQSNQDGTLTVIPPYGQVPFIYNPAGQVVEMPDGTKVTSFMAQRIAGLPAPANVSRQ